MKGAIKRNLVAAIVPLSFFISAPAISAEQSVVEEDLFLENTYEDYTLASGVFWADKQDKSEFAAMERGEAVGDLDVFHERDYEDYTLGI